MYGSTIQVRYFDASDSQVIRQHTDLLLTLNEERLPLPAVFLDGHLLFTGTINPLRVVATVAEEWQQRQQ